MTKFYTSYFAKIKNYPTITPISIARFAPRWFKDVISYEPLAPSVELLTDYKFKRIHENKYITIYHDEVLSKLDPEQVIKDLTNLSPTDVMAICCYEIPRDFCHRHLVAQWLRSKITIEELL